MGWDFVTVGVSLVMTGETVDEGAVEVVAEEIVLEVMVVETAMIGVGI